MRGRAALAVAAAALAFAPAGCDRMPGAKAAEKTALRPDQITDFRALYAANCQACHGANGQNGPAIDLANPEYQALVDDATLRNTVAKGMPGTEMPAFAQSAGGMLTDEQVDAIVAGMRKEWRKANAFGGATPPAYAQDGTGNEQHGHELYEQRCSICHQQPARQQVTSPVYLSLVSDQALRTIVIAGRPDIGQPDWRLKPAPGNREPPVVLAYLTKAGPPTPLAAQDVTDIITYLHTLRNPDAISAAPAPRTPRR